MLVDSQIRNFLFFALLIVLPQSVRAQINAVVPQYVCQDVNNGGFPEQAEGNPVKLNVPTSLTGKIALYSATNLGESIIAPAGWGCASGTTPHLSLLSVAQHQSKIGFDFSMAQPELAELTYSLGDSPEENLLFYDVVVPLFPQSYPGGWLHYIRPILKSDGLPISNSIIKQIRRLGPDDKIVRVNNHMVIVVTPIHTSGFPEAFNADYVLKADVPIYSIVGFARFKVGGAAVAYVIQIRPPSIRGYPLEELIKLNELQMDKDLSKTVSAN